jgi:hypothetical protein
MCCFPSLASRHWIQVTRLFEPDSTAAAATVNSIAQRDPENPPGASRGLRFVNPHFSAQEYNSVHLITKEKS